MLLWASETNTMISAILFFLNEIENVWRNQQTVMTIQIKLFQWDWSVRGVTDCAKQSCNSKIHWGRTTTHIASIRLYSLNCTHEKQMSKQKYSLRTSHKRTHTERDVWFCLITSLESHTSDMKFYTHWLQLSVNGYYEWVKIWTCEADQADRLTHSDDRLLAFAWICVCEWLTN